MGTLLAPLMPATPNVLVLPAACSEAVPLDKYFVIGNSDADDSQCLDATIKEASDCPDDSEFTSANTGTTDGVCTPCTGGLVSTSGAACGCGDAAANNYLQPGICTYDHSCANGTPDTADAATAGVEKCSSCDNLYRLEGDGCVIAASAAVCNPQRKPFVARCNGLRRNVCFDRIRKR